MVNLLGSSFTRSKAGGSSGDGVLPSPRSSAASYIQSRLRDKRAWKPSVPVPATADQADAAPPGPAAPSVHDAAPAQSLETAASRIQARLPGKEARAGVEPDGSEAAAATAAPPESESWAASRIQAQLRGVQARVKTAVAAAMKKQEQSAALAIQARQRGNKAREEFTSGARNRGLLANEGNMMLVLSSVSSSASDVMNGVKRMPSRVVVFAKKRVYTGLQKMIEARLLDLWQTRLKHSLSSDPRQPWLLRSSIHEVADAVWTNLVEEIVRSFSKMIEDLDLEEATKTTSQDGGAAGGGASRERASCSLPPSPPPSPPDVPKVMLDAARSVGRVAATDPSPNPNCSRHPHPSQQLTLALTLTPALTRTRTRPNPNPNPQPSPFTVTLALALALTVTPALALTISLALALTLALALALARTLTPTVALALTQVDGAGGQRGGSDGLGHGHAEPSLRTGRHGEYGAGGQRGDREDCQEPPRSVGCSRLCLRLSER